MGQLEFISKLVTTRKFPLDSQMCIEGMFISKQENGLEREKKPSYTYPKYPRVNPSTTQEDKMVLPKKWDQKKIQPTQ